MSNPDQGDRILYCIPNDGRFRCTLQLLGTKEARFGVDQLQCIGEEKSMSSVAGIHTSTGVILVLFILLVIISSVFVI